MPWIIQVIQKSLEDMTWGRGFLHFLSFKPEMSGLALPEVSQGMLNYTRNLCLGDIVAPKMPTELYTIQKHTNKKMIQLYSFCSEHSNLIMEVEPILSSVIKNGKNLRILFPKNALIHFGNRTTLMHSI